MTTKDLDYLLNKLGMMEESGHRLYVEEQLRQFRQAVSSASKRANAWITPGNYRIVQRELGPINERADELLEKIWCWHERRRNSSSTSSASSWWDVNKVTRYFNKTKFCSTINSELEELTSEYRRIVSTAAGSAAAYSDEGATQPADLQLMNKSDIVGRDEDVENIIRWIDQLWREEEEDDDEEEDKHNLHIISIVGMRGIGKTTVAQMVYSHPCVEDSFDLRIWVHVLPYLDYKVVLRRMAKEVTSFDNFLRDHNYVFRRRYRGLLDDHNYSVEELEDFLKEKLSGKKYLLVLDDFLHAFGKESGRYDGHIILGQLRNLSEDAGAQGTLIITTTRERELKIIMATFRAYELEGLSKQACWQLFCRSLSKDNLELLLQQHHEAEYTIVKFLHEKCCGLPIAARELAKRIEDQTLTLQHLDSFFLEPFTLITAQYPGGSLSLSYELLPIYLKNCFRFCLLFPRDHSYDRVEVDDIWISQRFAPPYHDQLWSECFFQKSEYSTDNKVTRKMHYLIHQFAVYLNTQSFSYGANRGSFQMMTNEQSVDDPQRCLHLSLIVDTEVTAFPKVLFSLKKLKTLILLRETQMVLLNRRCKISIVPPKLLARLKNLCVLDLQYTMIKKLPRTVGRLLNLKYLNLSETYISTIPKWIGRLKSLMFLKLVNCRYLRKLNDAVTNLVNLRKLDLAGCLFLVHVPDTNREFNMSRLEYLNIKDCPSLIQMPLGVHRYSDLHTLPRYIVGENDGCPISWLKYLHELEGELCVEHLEKVAAGVDAAAAELWNKRNLKKLTLKWNWNHADEEKDIEAIQEVLEELKPNRNLINLEIISYMGKQFPSWMIGIEYFDSLKEIKLFNLKGCKTLPPLGVLPHLMVVEISGMDSIMNVDDAFYGASGTFPSLQKLTFSQMLKLEKWLAINRRKMFPRLINLTIINCPELVALEMELPSVTELTTWLNNEGLYSSKGGLKGLTGSLKKLSISLCHNLMESSECQGLQELQALEELVISGCKELTSLPRGFRHLNSIKSLTIICCDRLMTLPSWSNDELTSLRSLSIAGCNLLRTIPAEVRGRPHLHLSLEACPMLL